MLGRRQPQIVAVVLEPLAHLNDVAVALSRQQPDPSASMLDQRIRGDGRAVDDALRLRQQRSRLEGKHFRQELQPVEYAIRWITGC